MQAISRASRCVPQSAHVPHRRTITTKSPKIPVQDAVREIIYHKLKVDYYKNCFRIYAPYGLCTPSGVRGKGIHLATIHPVTTLAIVHECAKNLFPNLERYLASGDRFINVTDQYEPIEEAIRTWQMREIQHLDPGHFSKHGVIPKAEGCHEESIKYYEMCIRIGVTIARSHAAMGNLAITLDRLYKGPVNDGTIFNNGGIMLSASEIVTPLGTLYTGNPSFAMDQVIKAQFSKLKVEEGSVRVDLDGKARPKCVMTPSGVTKSEAERYWSIIQDSVLFQACENVREEVNKRMSV